MARWFSSIYTFINIDIFPFCNFKFGAWSKRLFLFVGEMEKYPLMPPSPRGNNGFIPVAVNEKLDET